MNRTTRNLLLALILLALPALAAAQGGCVNSPENPTVVLALIGIAGATCSTIGSKLKRRHRRVK